MIDSMALARTDRTLPRSSLDTSSTSASPGEAEVAADRLGLVLESAHEAFVAIDDAGMVTEWNRAATVLFGWSAEEAIDQQLAELIIPVASREAHLKGLARFLAGGEPGVVDRRLELSALHRDGREFPVELTVSAVQTCGRWAFHSFMHDISERQAGARRTELLASIVDSSGDAMYTLSLDGTVTSWNAAAERLYGYRADEIVGCSIGRIVPDHLSDELATIAATVIDRGAVYEHESERVRKDGSAVWVALAVSPLRGADGAVAGRSAIARDMTAQLRTQSELRAAVERFEQIFEGAPIGMALGTLDGDLLQANRALRAFLGLREDEIAGRFVGSFTHPDDPRRDEDLLPELLAGRRLSLEVEKHYLHADGADRWATLHLSVVRDDHGDPSHLVAQFEDITARKHADTHLADYTLQLRQRMAEDPQTGLPTRRQLEQRLASSADAGPFALALLRVEEMATMIRHGGQASGDDALLTLVTGVAEILRGSDRLYRFDAETVVVEFAGADQTMALAAAARLRANAEATHGGLHIQTAVIAWNPRDGSPVGLLSDLELLLDGDAAAAASRPGGPLTDEAADRFSGLLAAVREHLGMDVAWLSEFTDGKQVFRSLEGDSASSRLERDAFLALDGSVCMRVLDGRLPAAIADTARDPIARELPGTVDVGIGAYLGAPVRLRDGHVYGMLCAVAYDARPGLDDRDVRVLNVLAAVIADQLDRERVTEHQRQADSELAGVTALLAALDARDHYTGQHSQAVVAMSGAVARELGLRAATVAEVEQVALLHDIGKVGIPDSVLQKNGPLSELEWDLMRQHSALGARIVASIGSLCHLAPAIRGEHERWDGGGYPDGLTGAGIPIAARIVLAADAYHAMTSTRPYRLAMTSTEALAEVRRGAATQFDPGIAAALIRVIHREQELGVCDAVSR